jgi:DNA polymerase (family X)
MLSKQVSNREISLLLDHLADLLEAKGENPFRIRSYRAAASSVASVRQSLARVVRDQGVEGLSGLKGVGEKLAGLIWEYVDTGTVQLQKELEKEVPPDKAKKVETKRADHSFGKPIEVPVDIILEVDAEYRRRAAEGKLKRIAPRLLNPEKKAWLPILTKEHQGFKFTVMFSNTPTAHKLGKTDDWVVVYVQKGKGENQCTVVTESRGPLKGKRVIRGREKECEEHYAGSSNR